MSHQIFIKTLQQIYISTYVNFNQIFVYPLLASIIFYQYAMRVNISDKRFQYLFDIAHAKNRIIVYPLDRKSKMF